MLKHRTVVVTGAGAGVGRATAVAFGLRGAKVALLARGEERLRAAAREVEEAGGTALPIPTDVSDADAVEAAAEQAESELGEIEVWVNDAMTTIFAPFHEIRPDEYRRATEVTYLGAVYGTMSAMKRMRPRDRGTIVQVGSALAYRAIPLQAPYCGAKFAIRGFTDSIRCELIHDRSRVHVTMVHLPGVNTRQFGWCLTRLPKRPQPVPPIYQPELMADAIVWASEHRRRELWVTASAVKVIVGNKFFPGLGDRYLAKNAYGGQQTDEPVSPDRPANLWEPVPGDGGGHGTFDDRAKDSSVQLALTKHRAWVWSGVALLVLAALVGLGSLVF